MSSEVAKKEQLATARATASQIRQGIHNYLATLALIARANKEQHWRVLGYADWQSYVDGEYGADRLRLPAEHRQKAVEELRLAGLSTRAIGAAVGASEATVRRDIAGASFDAPAETQGIDGKTYAAARPETPARRDPDPMPGSAVATPGGPAVDRPPAAAEEADGQPASPGSCAGPREAEGAPTPEAAGSSPVGDGLAVGQPAGDSHSSSEAPTGAVTPIGAADSSVEVSGDTSTDGEEELRVPALQPDSSGAAGAPAHFPAAGAPVDPLDDPAEVERQHRIRSSESVAKALATLLLRLDPDPIHWLENTWMPDAFRERDLPRVRDAFTADGLRLIAKHIESIADRVDRDGGVL